MPKKRHPDLASSAVRASMVAVNAVPPVGIDRLRILVADDHDLYRRGMQVVLGQEDDLEVVGEGRNGAEAVDLAVELVPDVVLMDVRMPVLTGIQACGRIKDLVPSAKILMLTMSDEEADLFDALRAGASGYLLKDEPAEAVIDGIRAVHAGHSMIPPQMAAMLVTEFGRLSRKAKERERGPKLTDREIEVLRLVARGAANKEIAKTLFISENTVKNHIRNILDKLQMHSRVAAAMYAMRTNLLDQD